MRDASNCLTMYWSTKQCADMINQTFVTRLEAISSWVARPYRPVEAHQCMA